MPQYDITADVESERTVHTINAYDIVNVVRRTIVRHTRSNDVGQEYFDRALDMFRMGGYPKLVEYSRKFCWVRLPHEWLSHLGATPSPTYEKNNMPKFKIMLGSIPKQKRAGIDAMRVRVQARIVEVTDAASALQIARNDHPYARLSDLYVRKLDDAAVPAAQYAFEYVPVSWLRDK